MNKRFGIFCTIDGETFLYNLPYVTETEARFAMAGIVAASPYSLTFHVSEMPEEDGGPSAIITGSGSYDAKRAMVGAYLARKKAYRAAIEGAQVKRPAKVFDGRSYRFIAEFSTKDAAKAYFFKYVDTAHWRIFGISPVSFRLYAVEEVTA